ncbi:hypothetical protein [Shewanella sedimentimangrovi]|uniref:Uncharacterized protein n=1 Tax=Shewanella sedimentimangrovi TaxID=2814293 RepID=A0ABX7R1Q3_9GAMM|nr:hypothetical protein [Shewanella sedimentimangrovi]QSX37106.1 hypothetical protein JYB85_17935 [Shewanella sedimentimangrovi]
MKSIRIVFLLFLSFSPLADAVDAKDIYRYQGFIDAKSDPSAKYGIVPLTINTKDFVISTFDVLGDTSDCSSKKLRFCIYDSQLIFSLPKHSLHEGLSWSFIYSEAEVRFLVRNSFILSLMGVSQSVYLIDVVVSRNDDVASQRLYYSEERGLVMFTALNSEDVYYWSADSVGLGVLK